MKIHFLNVGKGNCTIIEFPSNRLSIIDIDNSRVNNDDTLTDPLNYLKSKFPNTNPFRFILTHPDMDHLSGLNDLFTTIIPTNFWDTHNTKSIQQSEWDNSPYKKSDWDMYQDIRLGKIDTKYNCFSRGDQPDCCFIADGIEVLSPCKELEELANDTGEYNHISYVLRITYAGINIILGGDASTDVWQNILDYYGKEYLKADILLAPHHGSKNNIHDEAFKAISPTDVIISVVTNVDYDYDYYSKLAKHVYSTKYYGNISINIQENGVYKPIYVERNGGK